MVMKPSGGRFARIAPDPSLTPDSPSSGSLRKRGGHELVGKQLIGRQVRLEPPVGLQELERAGVVLWHVPAEPLLLVVAGVQDRQREVEHLPCLLRPGL